MFAANLVSKNPDPPQSTPCVDCLPVIRWRYEACKLDAVQRSLVQPLDSTRSLYACLGRATIRAEVDQDRDSTLFMGTA
jgi:hypothetical protein